MSQNRRLSSTRSSSNPALVIACVVVAIAVLIAVLELTGVTHFFHHSQPLAVSAGQDTKGEPTQEQPNNDGSASQTAKDNNTDSASQPGDNKSSSGGATTSAKPIAPTGDFVSNHMPGQNNSPMTETSVCNTSPGATCQISFTMGTTTLSLSAQTTDRGGATYWNGWTPASVGLTPGEWQITATATLNGQTSTTTDAIKLTVSP